MLYRQRSKWRIESEAAVMVDELRSVLTEVEHQPDDVQRRIAELIKLALEEQEWDALVSTPESQDFLKQLSREIDDEVAAGNVEDGGREL